MIEHPLPNLSVSILEMRRCMPKQQHAKAKSKFEPAIVVALIGLIGTVIAALIASPLLPTLIQRDATPYE
jgi:uncharacterized membrane protein